MSKLNIHDASSLSSLIDYENDSKNIIFSACKIKDDFKAIEMSKFLINFGKCDPEFEDSKS